MKKKDIIQIAEKINKTNSLECTTNELKQLLDYGILNELSKNKYISNTGKLINVNVYKIKEFRFTLNFSSLIAQSCNMATGDNIKRVYYMTKTTYEKHKRNNLIICVNNIEYFRCFDKEFWKVIVI